MESPDREYPIPISGRVRIHTMLGVTRGDVDWFVVQLEYNLEPAPTADDNWDVVARADHQPEMSWGHDIREEGLHIDLYENGEKVEREWYYSDIPVNEAPEWCETQFKKYSDYYLGRYSPSEPVTETRASE